MELAALYDHSITSNLATSLYVAAVGEPALGPVAYMHRPSDAVDPFAPIGHHWQDGSHESSGVVTGGVYTHAVKLEGSVFNGREGQSGDRYAGLRGCAPRFVLRPVDGAAERAGQSVRVGRIHLRPRSARSRPRHAALRRVRPDVHTAGSAGGAWSSAVIWGLNIHHHGDREHIHDATGPIKYSHPSSSVLIESTLDVTNRLALYGRVEQVQKSGDDLGFLGSDFMQLFTVRDLSLGATRELHAFGDASVGVGARGTITLLPETLRLTFHTRTPAGFALFLRIRPTQMRSHGGGRDDGWVGEEVADLCRSVLVGRRAPAYVSSPPCPAFSLISCAVSSSSCRSR